MLYRHRQLYIKIYIYIYIFIYTNTHTCLEILTTHTYTHTQVCRHKHYTDCMHEICNQNWPQWEQWQEHEYRQWMATEADGFHSAMLDEDACWWCCPHPIHFNTTWPGWRPCTLSQHIPVSTRPRNCKLAGNQSNKTQDHTNNSFWNLTEHVHV